MLSPDTMASTLMMKMMMRRMIITMMKMRFIKMTSN